MPVTAHEISFPELKRNTPRRTSGGEKRSRALLAPADAALPRSARQSRAPRTTPSSVTFSAELGSRAAGSRGTEPGALSPRHGDGRAGVPTHGGPAAPRAPCRPLSRKRRTGRAESASRHRRVPSHAPSRHREPQPSLTAGAASSSLAALRSIAAPLRPPPADRAAPPAAGGHTRGGGHFAAAGQVPPWPTLSRARFPAAAALGGTAGRGEGAAPRRPDATGSPREGGAAVISDLRARRGKARRVVPV